MARGSRGNPIPPIPKIPPMKSGLHLPVPKDAKLPKMPMPAGLPRSVKRTRPSHAGSVRGTGGMHGATGGRKQRRR